MGRISILAFISFALCCSLSAQQDSLKYLDLLRLEDTIRFGHLYEGLYGEPGDIFRNRRMKVKSLMKKHVLLDSIPQHQLYLYVKRKRGGEVISEFLLSYQRGDTAWVSGFTAHLPAAYQRMRVVQEGEVPVVELEYSEYVQNPSGSTELEISAFFAIDKFSVPLTRIVRKLWQDSHGSYEPDCKDFQFYSVEFKREVSVKGGDIHLGEGEYKYSRNMNCKSSYVTEALPGGRFEINDFLVVRKP